MCLPLGWPPPPPHTPPSCSLITAVRQPCLGSSHSIGHCCAALPWALAPLCPTHPVETTGPALCDTWHPVGLCRSGCSSSFLPGPSAQRSAADRRHLVCACAAGLPASAALTPNNRPQLQTSGFLLLLLAVTDPTLAS